MIVAEVTLPSPIQIEVTLPLLAVGGECAPATYRNNDGSYIQEINSGETFIAPTVNIRAPKIGNNDIDGQAVQDYSVNIPANTDHILPSTEAYPDPTLELAKKREVKPGAVIAGPIITIEDSLGNVILDLRSDPILLANGDIEFKIPVQELPDLDHTDSDGSTVTLPAQVPFTASPALTEVIVPQPLKITDPSSIKGTYVSQYSGDLIDLFSSGIFDAPDYSSICPRFRKCDPANIFRLDPSTPNPFGTLFRYTLLDGSEADVNETTWSSGIQISGKEYIIVDWLIEWGHYQPNLGLFSPVSSAFDEVISINSSSFKGFSDWIMTPLELMIKSFCPDLSADQSLNNSNFAKKGLISGSNEIWMWTPNYDWDTPTSIFTRSISGDHSRRPVSNSTTALYISRKIQLSDYSSYLP